MSPVRDTGKISDGRGQHIKEVNEKKTQLGGGRLPIYLPT